MNNNFIGALIAILVSILFAMNINNNNKKENYAGGMPPRRIKSQKIAAFVPNNNTDPSKVQFYAVSNFQSNPSQRGTNPEVGALLRTQLNNPSRLSNDLHINFSRKENFDNSGDVENFDNSGDVENYDNSGDVENYDNSGDVENYDNSGDVENYSSAENFDVAEKESYNYDENFADMVENDSENYKKKEKFENTNEGYSTYSGLPVVTPSHASGNFNDLRNKDVILTDMMPVGDMRAAVDDEGNPGNIYQFERFMYSNLRDNRNTRDSDFIRGDLQIPQSKGSCWFGQRGYTLRPSALGVLGGNEPTQARNITSKASAGMGDLLVQNKTR